MGFTFKICGFLLLWGIALADAQAVVESLDKSQPFVRNPYVFRSELHLPLRADRQVLQMNKRHLATRLTHWRKNLEVEPLSVLMTKPDIQAPMLAERISKPAYVARVEAELKRRFGLAKPVKKDSQTRLIVVDKKLFKMIEPEAFKRLHQRNHSELFISGSELRKDRKLRERLISQLRPFFSVDEGRRLRAAIRAGREINASKLLLPRFARKMVQKYINVRGPNCFHAALAFQDEGLTRSSLVNVKEEPGYHRAMINYDELWRILQANFYEINPKTVELRYGDMLVFFDLPKEHKRGEPINFRWIRHTSTHLFNGYTFAKGSKSPNTPYAVQPLAEEWAAWEKMSENLAVKVYRRTQQRLPSQPNFALTDWLY